MQRKIRTLLVRPNSLPEELIITNSLSAKQEIVGGDIEYAYMLDDPNVALICNEEGKLNGLRLNRDIGHDIIAGNFIIVGDNDTGEDRSLTDEQVEKYKQRFNEKSVAETEKRVDNILLKNIKIIEKERELC